MYTIYFVCSTWLNALVFVYLQSLCTNLVQTTSFCICFSPGDNLLSHDQLTWICVAEMMPCLSVQFNAQVQTTTLVHAFVTNNLRGYCTWEECILWLPKARLAVWLHQITLRHFLNQGRSVRLPSSWIHTWRINDTVVSRSRALGRTTATV